MPKFVPIGVVGRASDGGPALLARMPDAEHRTQDSGLRVSFVDRRASVGEQATVRRDPGAVEFELDPAIENGSQRRLFGFTRRAPQDRVLSPAPML